MLPVEYISFSIDPTVKPQNGFGKNTYSERKGVDAILTF